MEGQSFRDLCDDIQEHGLIEPIWMWHGQIIDGRNRYRACLEVDVEPRMREYPCAESELVPFVVSLNLKRRHLNEAQRAMVAAKIANLGEGRPKETAGIQAVSQSNAAELLNVSRDSVHQARKVQQQGTPELVKAVEQGKVSVSAAAAIASQPKEEQRRVIAADDHKAIVAEANRIKRENKNQRHIEREIQRETPSRPLPQITDRFELFHCSLTELPGKLTKPIDVIITDPPYPREFLPLYEDLAYLASQILPPGGSCVVMVGQSYLPDILTIMGKHLKYQWMLTYLTPGGQSAQLWDRKVNTFWKPLLWFVKDQYKGDWIGDVCKSIVNDKKHHHWGQSESGMEDIIKRFSTAGQTILDPFMGAGTTGLVAIEMDRLFVGCDIDAECVQKTSQRMVQCHK